MVVSPSIVVDVIGSVLLFRMYFFRSIFCRCFSAIAVSCFWTSAERTVGWNTVLCVIVISAPMVVRGHEIVGGGCVSIWVASVKLCFDLIDNSFVDIMHSFDST